jgi:lipopolysaccharide transport system ATP-binding protein
VTVDNFAIRAESLSKQYRIGRNQQSKTPLRTRIADSLRRIDESEIREDRHWALRDVSFSVGRGEVIGVIGRNGAGKSTLLKILSRITEPTSGQATIHGRVGSLLEVGTGFHPELTGRENIYLNGATLGMKRTEITRQFDEIVAFSEIEKFIDTPIKRYSSGMRVRLAFAVAAHLEPEILLVDEVLAVGDVAFQEKSLGKMGDVVQQGRTVLFVSHNMASVKHLCPRTIFMRNGGIEFDGDSDEAVRQYIGAADAAGLDGRMEFPNRNPEPDLAHEVTCIKVLDREGNIKRSLATGDYARFRIEWRSAEALQRGAVSFGIHTLEGVRIIQYSTQPLMRFDMSYRAGINAIDIEFESLPISGGTFQFAIELMIPLAERLYWNEGFAQFQIVETDVYESGTAPQARDTLLALPHRWIPSEPV